MIELRWFKPKQYFVQEDVGGELFGEWVDPPPVLQNRQMQNPEEIGLHEPIWSEWQDVPTVEEE